MHYFWYDQTYFLILLYEGLQQSYWGYNVTAELVQQLLF
jgi:hypothetical protein